MVKDHRREKYNIEECLSDFLIYFHDRVHSTTKIAKYTLQLWTLETMSYSKIRGNTIKCRNSAKILTEDYLKNLVRVS